MNFSVELILLDSCIVMAAPVIDYKSFIYENFVNLHKKYYDDLETIYEVKKEIALAKHGELYGYFELNSNKQWQFNEGIIWQNPEIIYWNRSVENGKILWWFRLKGGINKKNIILINYLNLTEFINNGVDKRCLYIEFEYHASKNVWTFLSKSWNKELKWYIINKIDSIRGIFTISDSATYKMDFTFNQNAEPMKISDVSGIEKLYESNTNPIKDKIIPFKNFIAKFPMEKILEVFTEKKEPYLNKCITCLERDIDFIFKCGHLTYCEECYPKAKQHECPLCRKSSKPIKIFK